MNSPDRRRRRKKIVNPKLHHITPQKRDKLDALSALLIIHTDAAGSKCRLVTSRVGSLAGFLGGTALVRTAERARTVVTEVNKAAKAADKTAITAITAVTAVTAAHHREAMAVSQGRKKQAKNAAIWSTGVAN